MALTKTVVATAQFVAAVDGKTVVVIQGARFAASSDVVKAHPEHFAPTRPRTVAK
jgi:hypothetical protein